MATRNPSSRLLSQVLRPSRSPRHSIEPLSTTPFTLRASRTLQSSHYIHTSRISRKENTAPAPPSQSQTNASVKATVQTPTGATTKSNTTSAPSAHHKYTFPEIQSISSSPTPNQILIDVREPSELHSSGTIPSSLNLPLKTAPDFMFLSAEEFEDRFGRPRPSADDEVIFYCRSGVRSRAAAELAKQASFGGTVSEFPGSWLEWEKNGGKVEKV